MRNFGIFMLTLIVTMVVMGEGAVAQTSSTEGAMRERTIHALAEGILDLTMGDRRRLAWTVCDQRLTGAAAEQHARELATIFVSEALNPPADQPQVTLDPFIMAAIAMQESALNRCAVGRQELRRLARAQAAAPDRRDPIPVRVIMQSLRSRDWREQNQIRGMDFGIVQVRYPGVYTQQAGIRRPEELFNPQVSIGILASNLRRALASCQAEPWSVREDARGNRVHPPMSCQQTYWVAHGARSRFRIANWRSVMRHYDRLEARRSEILGS